MLVEEKFASHLVLVNVTIHFQLLCSHASLNLVWQRLVGMASMFNLCSLVFLLSQIEMLKKTIKKFYGENPKELKDISKIVNKHHFQRLHNLLKEPLVAASIVHGGLIDEEKL